MNTLQPITIRYPFAPVRPSLATGQVRDLFGLDDNPGELVIAENWQIAVQPRDLVLFQGASGTGKSSLMRAVAKQLPVIDVGSLPLPESPLIDALAGPVEERLGVLAQCGLSEARLLLRTPAELSDGQRFRFRIAMAISRAAPGSFLMVDEFAAVLDRVLAKILAYNLRKLSLKSGLGILVATTHEDLVEDLNPNQLVRCHGEGLIEVEQRDVKKNASASRTTSGSRPVPSPTGRISHGGITAVTTLVSSGK